MTIRPDFFDSQTVAIVRRTVGIRAAQATLDSALVQDLHCDSLDFIQVAHALEDAFGIELTDQDIETADTIGDYAAAVRHRVAESYTLPAGEMPPRPPFPAIMSADQVAEMDVARRADAIGWDAHPRVLPCPITLDQLVAYNAEPRA